MAGATKQREWIWEYVLKNCNNSRMIQELLISVPFPDENVYLKKMLLLRSLSLHSSAGVIDELTLDILRGIGELSKVANESTPSRLREDVGDFPKKQKVPEDDKDDEVVAFSVEATERPSSCQRKGRVLPWNSGVSEQSKRQKGLKNDTIKDASVGEIANESRIAESAMCRLGRLEASKQAEDMRIEKDDAIANILGLEQSEDERDKRDERDVTTAGTSAADTDLIDGSIDAWSGYTFAPGQCPPDWEVQLLVMAELAVKHLRRESLNRKLFDHAMTKYWRDFFEITEGPVLEMVAARDKIKRELWMVQKNPKLRNDLVEKYSKARVEYIVKTYRDKTWEGIGLTFLERVSADVVSGKYKPINSSGKKVQKAAMPPADVENSEDQMSKTPWIRASRGRFSRTREKLQKRFGIFDLNQDDDEEFTIKPRNLDGWATSTTEEESSRLDRVKDVARSSLDNNIDLDCPADKHGGQAKLPDPEVSGLGIDSMSDRIGINADVAVEELPCEAELVDDVSQNPAVVDRRDCGLTSSTCDNKKACEDGKEVLSVDIEETEVARVQYVSRNTVVADLTECVPPSCSYDNRKAYAVFDLVSRYNRRQTSTADGEKEAKNARSAQSSDSLTAGLRLSNGKALDKENILPSGSPKPSELYQNSVCFSPPPWVKSQLAGLSVANAEGNDAPSLPRKRKSGILADAGSRELPISVDDVPAKNPTNQASETSAAQTNLQMKQAALDAAVSDPLPNILMTSRPRRSLLERNATACTLEWEDDDIEESPPNSPSASRNLRLPVVGTGHKISPLPVTKTSAVNITDDSRTGRRKHRKWSVHEVETLKKEVSKYGKGRWKLILESNIQSFQGRTEVDLKDKWRNLERFEGIGQ